METDLNSVRELNKGLPPGTKKDIESRTSEIRTLLTSVEADLQGVNRHRYQFSMMCLEEFIEAISFVHYLETQTLITMDEAASAIPADILLTEHDYMFGIFDLFGELMRFATVTTAHSGKLAGQDGRSILADIHELSSCFEILPEVPTKQFKGKMESMRTSVGKVEKLGYGLIIRGRERPKGWVPDMKEDVDVTMDD